MRNVIALLLVLILCNTGTASAQGMSEAATAAPMAPGLPAQTGNSFFRLKPPNSADRMRWRVAFFLAGASTPGQATLTLKAAGPYLAAPVVQSQTTDFNVNGIMIGLSLECAPTEEIGCRIEAYDLVPASNRSRTMTLKNGISAEQKSTAHINLDNVRVEGVLRLWRGLAAIGGLRYECLDMRLLNTSPVVSNLVSTSDVGNARFHASNMYFGAEYTRIGVCESRLAHSHKRLFVSLSNGH